LHKALKAAVADGLIPRNAAADLKLPRITREEIDPLSQEEARRLLEAAAGDRLEALLYVLTLNTGMREGVLLALKWDDVDLERGVLRVRRTLTHADKAYVLGEPKTNKSRRTIRLTTSAVRSLRAHLSRQLEEMERMGSLYQPGGLIFATETGTIINPSNLRNRSFNPLLKRARLRPIRFHDLRHAASQQGRQPQDRLRDARALLHKCHPRHLLPPLARHAGEGHQGPGGGAALKAHLVARSNRDRELASPGPEHWRFLGRCLRL